MKWGLKQRLAFIETKLFWEGTVNRRDITETFGVSVPQASSDIKVYRTKAPNNIYYDNSQKQYRASLEFEPIFGPMDPHEYLSKLGNVSAPKKSFKQGTVAEFSIVPSLDRNIDAAILRQIITALKKKQSVLMKYQSMSRPSPVWRWFSPHAFVFDGFRWHVRGFCELTNEFRDFILGRVWEIKGTKEAEANAKDDHKWNHFVSIHLIPHPSLSSDQKKVIEKEYNMENGVAALCVREAFVYYVLSRFRVNVKNESKRAENENILVSNYKEIEAYI